MGRRSRKRGESTRAERDAARRSAPRRRRPAPCRPSASPDRAVGQLPALRARHPARHRPDPLGRRARVGRRGDARGRPRDRLARRRRARAARAPRPATARTRRCSPAWPPSSAVTVVALGLGPVKVWMLARCSASLVFAGYVLRDARALQAPLGRARIPVNERPDADHGDPPHHAPRVQDLERSVAFYRNLLGHAAGRSRRSTRTTRAPATSSSATPTGGRHADHLPRVPGPRRGQGRPRLHPSLRPGGRERGGAGRLAGATSARRASRRPT